LLVENPVADAGIDPPEGGEGVSHARGILVDDHGGTATREIPELTR
jgi:hypothetical protein